MTDASGSALHEQFAEASNLESEGLEAYGKGGGNARLCPCGSGRRLVDCCEPYFRGACRPETAEALMRSRYTAYVLRDEDYLRRTWHPSTRPARLDLENDDALWESLTVVRCRQGSGTDREGEVEFTARYRHRGRLHRLHEVSRFVRENGVWYYLDGIVKTGAGELAKPGRNEPCSCGSGRKFKKCCGA